MAILILSFLCQAVVLAQGESASRVTPATIEPESSSLIQDVELPSVASTAAPNGSQTLTVQIVKVNVEGGLAQFSEAVEKITKSVIGRVVTVAELYTVASRIEGLYASKGYVLTRAAVPEQRLTNGAVFQVRIVEGFVESIDVSEVPVAFRTSISKRLKQLVGKRGLTLEKIERPILLAGRLPGVILQTTLIPGKEVGGVQLIATAQRQKIEGALSLGNNHGEAYGDWSISGQVVANGLLAETDQVYGFLSSSPELEILDDAPQRNVVGLGFRVPIGLDGLTANIEYIHADTSPDVPVDAVTTVAELDRLSLRFRYPLVLSRNGVLMLEGSVGAINEKQEAVDFGVDLSEDRLRYVSLGIDWKRILTEGISVGLNAHLEQGIDGLGARNNVDAQRSGIPLSRVSSKPDYSRFSTTLTSNWLLGNIFEAAFTLRGQASLTGALPSSAQFSLDGAAALSGFVTGSISVDSGLTARTELKLLQSGPSGRSSSRISPYLFGAYGVGSIKQPTALEHDRTEGWSAGIGLRGLVNNRMSFNAEVVSSDVNLFGKGDTGFTLSASIRF